MFNLKKEDCFYLLIINLYSLFQNDSKYHFIKDFLVLALLNCYLFHWENINNLNFPLLHSKSFAVYFSVVCFKDKILFTNFCFLLNYQRIMKHLFLLLTNLYPILLIFRHSFNSHCFVNLRRIELFHLFLCIHLMWDWIFGSDNFDSKS